MPLLALASSRRRPKEDFGDLRAIILRPRITWPHKQMRPMIKPLMMRRASTIAVCCN